MARVHGADVNFAFNSVNLEASLNSVVMTMEVPEADITSFGDAWQNFLAGKPNTKTDIAGTLDMAASTADVTLHEAFEAGPLTTNFDPVGGGPAADNPEYVCTSSGLTGALVESYTIDLPVGGAGTYQATLQHSGSTARNLS